MQCQGALIEHVLKLQLHLTIAQKSFARKLWRLSIAILSSDVKLLLSYHFPLMLITPPRLVCLQTDSHWCAQGALRSSFLFLCVGLVLVPTPLLEPRYFTLPALMLRRAINKFYALRCQ